MTKYAALLRAVNVGGKNKIAMEDIRRLFASLGYKDAVTYVQSGNVVFTSPIVSESTLVRRIEERFAAAFHLDVKVLLRTEAQLERIQRANPFLTRATDTGALYVTFLADAPASSRIRTAKSKPTGIDRYSVVGREVYLHCRGGYGKTKLNNTFFEKQLATSATTRNWNTVTRLLKMMRDQTPNGYASSP